MTIIGLLIAYVFDLIIGDPYHWQHPVKWMGNYIQWFLKLKEKWKINAYIIGAILWLTTVGLTVGVSVLILHVATLIHPVVYWIIWVYLSYTTLATRSLALEAKKVYVALTQGTLAEARQQVGMIVGRQTQQLTKEEIIKATVETVAENTSDGVIGPLLCLFIGGPVLAMGYKAINTLDSMVGYKHEKYYKIGFVSAKMDDLINLIPARVSFIMLLMATHILHYDIKKTVRIAWRDRYNHASPNSAFTEAVVAGALQVQLGGAHLYHGEWVDKPTIGDDVQQVKATHILETNAMLFVSTSLTVTVGTVIYLLLSSMH